MKQLDKLSEVLKQLSPYVIVVGSYAREEAHSLSDIDLYIKKRPESDDDFYGDYDEHYIEEVIGVFESNGLAWDSLMVGYVHTNDLKTQIEASALFKIHKDAEIKKLVIFGVEMDCAVDDKDLKYEETIEYI